MGRSSVFLLFGIGLRTGSLELLQQILTEVPSQIRITRNLKEVPSEVHALVEGILECFVISQSRLVYEGDELRDFEHSLSLRAFDLFSEIFLKTKLLVPELVLIPFWKFENDAGLHTSGMLTNGSDSTTNSKWAQILRNPDDIKDLVSKASADEICKAVQWLEATNDTRMSRRSRRQPSATKFSRESIIMAKREYSYQGSFKKLDLKGMIDKYAIW
jgi:hypothetical protein